jgi:hypothetical protein
MAAGGRLLDAVGVVYQTLHGANFISVPICVYSYFPEHDAHIYDAQSLRVYLREACAREAPCARLARGLRERLLAPGLREAPCSRLARDLRERLLARGSLRDALRANLARGLR